MQNELDVQNQAIDGSSKVVTKKKKKRKPFGWPATLLLSLLLFAVSIAVLIPPVQVMWTNYNQYTYAQQYGIKAGQIDKRTLDADFKKAQEYNKTLTGMPILDPYSNAVSTDKTGNYKKYLEQLALQEAMGQIRVPAVNINLPFRHGTDDHVLATGAGHLYGTSLPVGGVGTRAVLSSHTGLTTASLFDRLLDVKDGDLMMVDVDGQTLTYRVNKIEVIKPEDIGVLKAVPGHDLLTLFTCTPYGINDHRLVITGERIDTPAVALPAAKSADLAALGVQEWMYAPLASVVVSWLAIIYLITSKIRYERARKKASARKKKELEFESSQVD